MEINFGLFSLTWLMQTQGRDTIYKMTDSKSWRQSKLVCLQFGLSENLTISYFNSRKFIISYKNLFWRWIILAQCSAMCSQHDYGSSKHHIMNFNVQGQGGLWSIPMLCFRGRENFLLSFPTPPPPKKIPRTFISKWPVLYQILLPKHITTIKLGLLGLVL